MKNWKPSPKRRAIFTTAIAWTLTACATSTKPSAAASEFNLPDMPAQIARPCEPLAEIADTKGKTVLQWAAQTVAQYQDCAARHDAAVLAYRALSGAK